MNEIVSLEKKDGFAWITLNRPESANALSLLLLKGLGDCLRLLADDADVRVILLKGAGERIFCAGADLKERAGMSQTEARGALRTIGEVVEMLAKLPQPTIACLNGGAYGGGLELALACDFRFAADGITMGLTETSLGIIPGAGGTQRLPRLIGPTRAKQLIFTAERISAAKACHIGLVDQVVQGDQLYDFVERFAAQMAQNAPLAVRAAKKAITLGMETDLNRGVVIEREVYEELLPTLDRLEGLRAFAEKRKPNYMGH